MTSLRAILEILNGLALAATLVAWLDAATKLSRTRKALDHELRMKSWRATAEDRARSA